MSRSPRALVDRLRELYPALAGLPARDLDNLVAQGSVVTLPAGTPLFAEGSPCGQFPLVLEGSIRVAKVGEGRELRLYRVTPGESCVLTSSCLVGARDYPATGVVESDARLVVLPKRVFDALMESHAPFRQYVFGLFADRLTDLMGLVEAVAFHKLDRRVAAALLGHGAVVSMTHQQLADAVGSVREIVTRVLKSLADEGVVRLGRGTIEILDAARLRQIAEGA